MPSLCRKKKKTTLKAWKMSEFLAADLEEEKTIQSNTVRGCFSKGTVVGSV